MPDRATIIKNATIRARNDWVKYSAAQEKAIYSVFDQTANEITKQIERFTVEGKVVPARLTTLLNNVKEEMVELRPALRNEIRKGMRQSVDYGLKTGIRGVEKVLPPRLKLGIGTSFIGKDGKIRRYDAKLEAYKDSMWGKINASAMDALFRYQPAGITLSDRIWDIAHGAEKAIRNRIQVAVLQGESATRLSRDIRGFLVEPERLYRRVQKTGKLVLSGPAKAYSPGMGISRSSYKNAMRLTRTELARAYHEGTIRYGLAKDWIKGWIWRTASGNPCPICADLDGTFYPKETPPPIPIHPNCFCYAEEVIDEDRIS